jgi:gas vesicle protein
MFHHEDRFCSGFLAGAFVAGTLGTMAALLFSTKKGKELQKDALDKFHHFEEMAEDLLKTKQKKKRAPKKEK